MQPTPSAERRTRRSSHASLALNHQLSHLTQRFDLAGMVLADRSGNLWAASALDPARRHLARSVAAVGSALACGQEQFSIASGAGQSVRVRTLRIGDALLFLAAQGRQRLARPALEHASCGVQRILGSLLS